MGYKNGVVDRNISLPCLPDVYLYIRSIAGNAYAYVRGLNDKNDNQ
jgi:hypothetical protein